MNCFPCFSSKTPDPEEDGAEERLPVAEPKQVAAPPVVPSESHENDTKTQESGKIAAKAFTFREMAIATKNFRQECLIFDDGFGKVYKGTLKPRGEVVAIKQLDRNGMKGTEEFLEEVGTLSALKHPNLTNLIGYCADGDQRILVYEYMPFGSLETRLLARPEDESPLDWVTRMKIATGAAQGLQCLHEEANPPLLYRDFRSSNILLDEEFNPKLCDFGLAKIAESGNKTSAVPPRAMGTYGYSAPEYASTGELTLKSDIYSFGVVLLELISGRRAIEPDRPAKEQNLVTWAQPIFRDPRRFPEMADPHLMLNFSIKSLNQAVGVAAMCLQEEPTVRPYITDVVTALSFLNFDANDPPAASLPSSAKESIKDDDDDGDKTDNQSENSSSNQEGDINNDDDKSDRSSNQEEIVNNDNDDDRSDSSSDQEENVNNDNQNVNNDNDDDRSDSSSDHEENVNNDNDDDKSSSSPDHDDNDNRESHANVVSDQEDDENISETHDDNRVSSSDDNGNINDIGDDMSGYFMADEDTALTIEIDSETSSSDILPDEDSGEEDDDAEIRQKLATKSSNSEKGKMIEISDDESIYSLSSSRSSGSGIDSKLGEKKTTQKAKSTKKSSVGNSSVKKSKRWRRAKLVLNHETENR